MTKKITKIQRPLLKDKKYHFLAVLENAAAKFATAEIKLARICVDTFSTLPRPFLTSPLCSFVTMRVSLVATPLFDFSPWGNKYSKGQRRKTSWTKMFFEAL